MLIVLVLFMILTNLKVIDLLENYVLQYLYINEYEGKKHVMVNNFIPYKV